MKRFMTILAVAVLVLAPAAFAQSGVNGTGTFGWTVSGSSTNPLVNTGPIAPGPSTFAGNLYLWLYCDGSTPQTGMAACEMDVTESAGSLSGFTPLNGFLNAGTATALLLAVGSCPHGPVLAGSFAVGPDAFIPTEDVCLVSSAANNFNLVVGCDQLGYANDVLGFSKTNDGSCYFDPTMMCKSVSVEQSTWGQIKGLYR